jgi:hypothetical protein
MVGSSRVAALRSQHELSDPARAELGGTLPGRWSSDHRQLPLQCPHSCVGGPRSSPGVGVACHCWSFQAVGDRLLLGLRGPWFVQWMLGSHRGDREAERTQHQGRTRGAAVPVWRIVGVMGSKAVVRPRGEWARLLPPARWRRPARHGCRPGPPRRIGVNQALDLRVDGVPPRPGQE